MYSCGLLGSFAYASYLVNALIAHLFYFGFV